MSGVSDMGPGGRVGTLYVIHHREYSGAETSQAVVIRADPDALVACPADSKTAEFVKSLGAGITPIAFRSLRASAGAAETARSVLRGLLSARDLRGILRRCQDRRVIYAIGPRSGLIATVAAIGMRRMVVWTMTDRLPPGPLGQLIRLVARVVRVRFICLSRYVALDLVRNSRDLKSRTCVINPGVDFERFRPQSVEPGAPIAATVGHISRVKRTDLAVDIAARVAVVDSSFRLLLIGSAQFHPESSSFEHRLRERIDADTLTRKSVEFLGYQADVVPALSGCGLLLHCRPDEPFGMAVVEAMALGLPVVAPAAGGLLEIIDDGISGLLFPADDDRVAAECVRKLINDRALAKRLGDGGRQRVETHFTSVRQLEQTSALLRRL